MRNSSKSERSLNMKSSKSGYVVAVAVLLILASNYAVGHFDDLNGCYAGCTDDCSEHPHDCLQFCEDYCEKIGQGGHPATRW